MRLLMKILIVDDSVTIREKLRVLIVGAMPEAEVLQATNGIDALTLADKHLPDLITMDIQMPEMTGYEALRILQTRERTKTIPVIFLTGTFQESEDIIRGLELGAVEYVTKPINDHVFLARLKVMLRLKAYQERILMMSLQDPLTECYNRRYLMQRLREEFNRSARTRAPISGVMIDLDHFKAINDAYGHDTGDAVLLRAVSALRVAIRTYDVLARYGGEEFFLLLPNTDTASARTIAERMRQMIERLTVPAGGEVVQFTASFGVAGFPGEGLPKNPETLLKRSDEALYTAKEGGRNRVEVHPGGPVEIE